MASGRNMLTTVVFLVIVAAMPFSSRVSVGVVPVFLALAALAIVLILVNPTERALPDYMLVLMYWSNFVRVPVLAPLVAFFFAAVLLAALALIWRTPPASLRSGVGVVLCIGLALITVVAQRVLGATLREVAVGLAIVASAGYVFELWRRSRERRALLRP